MLQGKRVLLRAMMREDLAAQWQFNNDLEVELAGGGDPPIPQSLERLLAEFDQEASRGGRNGTVFAIEADEQFIGQCALFHMNSVARNCALGITIGNREYWGRGYGRECVALLVDYAFVHHNFYKVWLQVHANNGRALRCYAACGFREEGRLRDHVWSNGRYDDLIMMGLLRTEWQPV